MFSLRHLAAAQIPRNIRATQPVRATCEFMYGEAVRESVKLGTKLEEWRSCVDHRYEEYNSALNPKWDDFMEEFVEDFEYAARNIVEQYHELESLDFGLDYEHWYAYIEYAVCRAIEPNKTLTTPFFRTIYPTIMGIKAIINGIPEPNEVPGNELVPIVQSIRTYVQIMNKYLEQYDAKYSYKMCDKLQKSYGKTLSEWQGTIRPTIMMKMEFYRNVCSKMRSIYYFIPNVCMKIS